MFAGPAAHSPRTRAASVASSAGAFDTRNARWKERSKPHRFAVVSQILNRRVEDGAVRSVEKLFAVGAALFVHTAA